MLDDTRADDGEPEQEQGMLILAINETYWLAEGSQWLTPMLDGSGPFPKPVLCVRFSSSVELRAFMGEDCNLLDFWSINPDIIERLRRDDHLKDVNGDNL